MKAEFESRRQEEYGRLMVEHEKAKRGEAAFYSNSQPYRRAVEWNHL